MVPAVVSGFLTFPGTNLPYTFQSQMGFVSGSSSSAQFQVRYQDNVTGVSTTRTVTVPARRTLEYRNVLEELFGIPKGARSEEEPGEREHHPNHRGRENPADDSHRVDERDSKERHRVKSSRSSKGERSVRSPSMLCVARPRR